MKGRIIGREGRNIRAIEAATGVDLIIDDTPEAVVDLVPQPDPPRARPARARAPDLRRPHPSRAASRRWCARPSRSSRRAIREAGQKADLRGRHPRRPSRAGASSSACSSTATATRRTCSCTRSRPPSSPAPWRPSSGSTRSRRAAPALLHDIGKALTHEVEGSHAIIGGDIARKYGESAKIVNAIAAHHEEVKAETILAPLVDAADALSGARPGRAARDARELRASGSRTSSASATRSRASRSRSPSRRAARSASSSSRARSATTRRRMLARDVARKIERR